MHYGTEDELMAFDRCANDAALDPGLYYACFVIDPKADESGPVAAPPKVAAVRKHRRPARVVHP